MLVLCLILAGVAQPTQNNGEEPFSAYDAVSANNAENDETTLNRDETAPSKDTGNDGEPLNRDEVAPAKDTGNDETTLNRDEPSPATPPPLDAFDEHDLDGWLSDMESDPSNTSPQPSDDPKKAHQTARRQKARDILTGYARLYAGFLRFPDQPELFPDRAETLVSGVGRLLIDHRVTSYFSWEANLFIDLSRAPTDQSNDAALFNSAGSVSSVYRMPYASWTFWNEDATQGSMGIDRLALHFDAGPVRLSLGRLPVSPTVNQLFTPNDVFAPFSATAINRLYKPGIDLLLISAGLGPNTHLVVFGALGWNDDDHPSFARSAIFARASHVAARFEWSLVGGKVAERWLVGSGIQGDIGPIGLRFEGHVGFPDRNGNGRMDAHSSPHVRVAGGPNLNLAWHNTSLNLEYAYFSTGEVDAANYIQYTSTLYPDDVPWLGRHYVGLSSGLDLIPILRLDALGLVNLTDGSGLVGGFLSYSVADEADLVVGAYAPWGRSPTSSLPPLPRSEFGLAPLTTYLEMRAFF